MKSIFNKEYKKILDFLLRARTNLGITQKDLAKRISRPQSFVSKYERGERRLDIVEFMYITSALEVTHKDIFNELKKIASSPKGGV